MIHVVLYEPEIPGNTGNIMRTCMATNAKLHLIEPLGFELSEKTLRRAAMDYLLELDYQLYPDWDHFWQINQPEAIYFSTRYGHQPPSQFDFPKDKDIYLVFGKESTGIDKGILKDHLETCMRLPMVADARSLNLSNSVAIVVYEVLRQLDYPGLACDEAIKGADFLESL